MADKFTALAVRIIRERLTTDADACWFWDAREALMAYAERLEQDESGPPVAPNASLYSVVDLNERPLRLSEPVDPHSWSPSLAWAQFTDRVREEGRREILKEIAAIEPYGIPCDSYCRLCGDMDHKPECLWLRAQAVVKPAEPA